MAWEEMLLDNLLNFAATPKGLMLLQQTGATHECVAYMFTRFTKKLQVQRKPYEISMKTISMGCTSFFQMNKCVNSLNNQFNRAHLLGTTF